MIPYVSDPVFRRKCTVLFGRMIRTRNPDLLEGQMGKTKLTRCLTPVDLTSLGVGSCVGTGMYLVAGMVARNYAGPGVIFSFAIAAVAALFSGVCYAEFGVRVPHTTGSAYMYSYVTVGEFLAFVIGWNMLLEYLIGSAACACALSACFNSLSNGAIADSLSDSIGTIFGRPPDVLAFAISVSMTLLLVAGVKKSLVFNNALNAINFSIWVFIMTVGLFYADFDNWSKHGGFLPKGWPGVLTGAATCFYAFIGFDIIATTGEEAIEPKRTIPRAIIMSLVIIVTAYVTTGMMATLVLPYDQLDENSALVEMFRGSSSAKFIVSIGATAGLTVSMFGSMFPMPRVVYAMAKDGLIFKFLAEVWPMTGTPAIATCIFGLAAAFAALIIRLDVLVEMMSIGTLLAYTLVSTCVLVLRYQPNRLSLVEFLPESMRITDGHKSPSVTQKSKITSGIAGPRKVVRIKKPSNPMTSPDSCDEASACEDRRFSTSPTDRDDDYLGSGGGMDKPTYGSLPSDGMQSPRGVGGGGGTTTGGGPPPAWAPMASSLGILLERLRLLQTKLPIGGNKPWREPGEPTDESGLAVTKLVGIFYLIVLVFDLLVVCDINYMDGSSSTAMFFIFILLLCIVGCLLYISRKPQCRQTLKFMAPGIPFVPGIAITVNIYLIFKLSILTLIRFTFWMIIGLGVYFYYGIKNSTMEDGQSQNMEMMAQSGDANDAVVVGNTVSNNYYSFPDPRDTEPTVDTYGGGTVAEPDTESMWTDQKTSHRSKGGTDGERRSDW